MSQQEHDPKPAPDKEADEKSEQTAVPDEADAIDSNAALSPAVEQQGGAALANVGKRRGSEVFRE